jgi:nucleotide-binding universal stress UspA family protein
MNRIVVGYDGSEGGRDALGLARRLARVEAAELLVACVWAPDPLLGDALAGERKRPDWFAARFAEVKAQLGETAFRRFDLTGPAPSALVELAEIERAEIIVLGSTHRGRLGRVAPGGVGERVLQGSPCAVAVAPRGYAHGEHVGLGLVGVGYDGREESERALAFAREIADHLGAALRLITAVPAGATAAGEPVTAGERVFRQGDPAATLAEQGVEVDLLVLGSRAFGPLLGTVLGEVSHEVMRTAPCPVVVVPRPSRSAATPRPRAAARR